MGIDKSALIILKVFKPTLTKEQYYTLRGQVLSGDADGARRGLETILRRRESNAG